MKTIYSYFIIAICLQFQCSLQAQEPSFPIDTVIVRIAQEHKEELVQPLPMQVRVVEEGSIPFLLSVVIPGKKTEIGGGRMFTVDAFADILERMEGGKTSKDAFQSFAEEMDRRTDGIFQLTPVFENFYTELVNVLTFRGCDALEGLAKEVLPTYNVVSCVFERPDEGVLELQHTDASDARWSFTIFDVFPYIWDEIIFQHIQGRTFKTCFSNVKPDLLKELERAVHDYEENNIL